MPLYNLYNVFYFCFIIYFMNRVFITISIIIATISIIIGLSTLFNSEVGFSPEFNELKNLKKTYPDLKKTGFVTDNKSSEYYFYKAQNSVIPIFVTLNENLDYLICFEEKNHTFCKDFCKHNNYKIIQGYSKSLYLLKKEGASN